MPEAKTQPTTASVAAFIDAIDDPTRRADCNTIVKLMRKATGARPVMWGTAIVGFGTCRLTYAGGRTGDWPVIAFAPRKNDLTLYLEAGFEQQTDLMARLGKYKTGKVCLYLKKLADVDLAVLAELLDHSVAKVAPIRLT